MTPPRQLGASGTLGLGGGARNVVVSTVTVAPLASFDPSAALAFVQASCTAARSTWRQRTTADAPSSATTPCTTRSTRSCLYAGDEALEKAASLELASATRDRIAASRAPSTFSRVAFSAVEYSLYLRTGGGSTKGQQTGGSASEVKKKWVQPLVVGLALEDPLSPNGRGASVDDAIAVRRYPVATPQTQLGAHCGARVRCELRTWADAHLPAHIHLRLLALKVLPDLLLLRLHNLQLLDVELLVTAQRSGASGAHVHTAPPGVRFAARLGARLLCGDGNFVRLLLRLLLYELHHLGDLTPDFSIVLEAREWRWESDSGRVPGETKHSAPFLIDALANRRWRPPRRPERAAGRGEVCELPFSSACNRFFAMLIALGSQPGR